MSRASHESLPVPEGELQVLRERMHEAARLLSQGKMDGLRAVAEQVQKIEPSFQWPRSMRSELSSPEMFLDLRMFAEIEDLINERVFVPRGFFYFHERLGVGPEFSNPPIVSGKILSLEKYCEIPGEVMRVATVELDPQSTLLVGMARGTMGYVNKVRLRERARNAKELTEDPAIAKFLAAHVPRTFSEQDIFDVWLRLNITEEGEHALSDGLERTMRRQVGKADFLHMFICPQYHAALRQFWERFDPHLAKYETAIDVENRHDAESEETFLNLAAGEVWASLRSTIRTMEFFIEKGEPAKACLAFWRYVGERQGGSDRMDVQMRLKAFHDPLLEAIHEFGNKLIMDMLAEEGFDLSMFDEALRMRPVENRSLLAGEAASKFLELLKAVAEKILVDPYGVTYTR